MYSIVIVLYIYILFHKKFLIENNTSVEKCVLGNLMLQLLRLHIYTTSQPISGED